ncbi:hypothetical protein NM688_g2332 [Phlebia brevispora]|uniref:Uncharacterized protein n=1 Tax=Phlebia brevispora TaxID=194682 RepID=A0ACC1T961_9APHY|nr:hypothetical protein NM688_g2332 [Phlebia brevispora]
MSGRRNQGVPGSGQGPRRSPQSLVGRARPVALGAGRGGGGRGTSTAITSTPSSIANMGSVEHIQTVGVRRPNFGTSGIAIKVVTNHFKVDIPDKMIYHYDAITPDEQRLPTRATMQIIRRLQEVIAPQIFTPRAVYDGRKNLFSIGELPFPDGAQTFDVTLEDPPQTAPQPPARRRPKMYKVTLTQVARINTEVLSRFINSQQSSDNTVLTAITALNVVIRTQPNLQYPFNKRCFYTAHETKDIGKGIVLWRGYFQSIRPALGRMLINVDTTTGYMYKHGPLVQVCKEVLDAGRRLFNPQTRLSPNRATGGQLTESERLILQRSLAGVRINITMANGMPSQTLRTIKKFSSEGASALRFTTRQGNQMTVADYFRRAMNRPLDCPHAICVEVGNGAMIPIERCEVLPGQIMHKQVPDDKVKDVVEFATRMPQERLESIRKGLGVSSSVAATVFILLTPVDPLVNQVLEYGQSEYVRQFGLNVDQHAIEANARILPSPTIRYGEGSTFSPSGGSWNLRNRKLLSPVTIRRWCIVIFGSDRSFARQSVQYILRKFLDACKSLDITVTEFNPTVEYVDPQSAVAKELLRIGNTINKSHGDYPQLLVVVLPENATEMYRAIKHFGDIMHGVPTQCMKASKCAFGNDQYFANICLKVNVKIGGINAILNQSSAATLVDPHNPTIVMGADVVHPSPGSQGRPSFASLVASVDSGAAKYVADCRVQAPNQEMIAELDVMNILQKYMDYRAVMEKKADKAPKRIIFYRDGVSESQFQQVLDQELRQIQKACNELQIKPRITIIVVGKRHHVRLFPRNDKEGDARSKNCKAGTVVDRDITHPLEFDFYLLSHAGILGTSRPAHYNVLHDDNGFTVDAIQAFSFALCHVYARSTRSVSIPAPVYYADIVCARAKNHYSPESNLNPDQSESHTSGAASLLEDFKREFKPLHPNMTKRMYFT